MNIVFAGTPLFALPCLDAILHSEHHIKAVYTQPDRPKGRGHQLQSSPVKTWALTHGFAVHQPLNFKHPATIEAFAALAPDILIVIAYGLILPKAILEIPRYGCINVHASLLPRWRGASPIQHAILHQDAESGLTIMQMDEGMDTGDILTTVSCPLDPRETTETLHHKLSQLAPDLLLKVLHALSTGTQIAEPQPHHDASYAPKINKNHAAIDWHQKATTIDSLIRAFTPWPTAYTHAAGETVRIHQARVIPKPCSETPGTILAITQEGVYVATGLYILLIERLQFAGGKILHIADWLHANRPTLSVNLVLQ